MSTTPPTRIAIDITDPDPLPEPGPGGPGVPGDERPRRAKRYTRDAAFDKRIGRGDDYAGDAWRDRVLGIVRWMPFGVDPNRP